MRHNFFDEIGQKISETIANSPAKDLEKNIKVILNAAFTKMDLVTREEFDIQQQVLLKTREQLAALEQKISQLEQHGSRQEHIETQQTEN